MSACFDECISGFGSALLREFNTFACQLLKAVAKTFCNRPIANAAVNRIGCRIGQVGVKYAAKAGIAHMLRKRMNARRSVAPIPLVGWSVDPGNPNYAFCRLSTHCHRHRLPVIPEP